MTSYSGILKTTACIGGRWSPAASGETFAVTNPATGTQVATVADCAAADAEAAVKAAATAFQSWKQETAQARGEKLKAWAGLIQTNLEALAALLTAEQGKPLAEARTEIKGGIESVEWSAQEARRANGDIIPPFKKDTQILVTREPVGVVSAITPWNFPVGMITRKVAPALAAGCTVVLKPAEDTPLCALALAYLAEQAGIPAGVFNVVPCRGDSAPEVGKVLTTHPLVRKVSFTGSTEVGKILMQQASGTVKRVSLELGGNAPFIVFASADLDMAVAGAIASKFRNAGQTCVCANRIFVEDSIHDAFVAKLTEKIKAMPVGAGDKDGTQIGPLINEDGLQKVASHVDDAVKRGATLLYGGKRQKDSLFFEPTVLTGMTPSMKLFSEETFGPVAGIFKFSSEAEVISQANDSNFGLAAYFYSRDLGQCFRVSAALQYGMIGVNEAILANAAIPFGGTKESGVGREGGVEGFSAFLETKYTLVGGLA